MSLLSRPVGVIMFAVSLLVPALASAAGGTRADYERSAKLRGLTRNKVFRERVPGAKGQPHVTISGGGHFLQEGRGVELARVVADFVNR